jgi:hypothetical protein
MSKFEVLSYEYLEGNKDTNFYEFKKNPNFKGWTLKNPPEPVYIGKYISRVSQGSQNNYFFVYKFEKGQLHTSGENSTLIEYVLRDVDESEAKGKGRGKKNRRTRKNRKSRKSKKYRKSRSRR